MVQHADIDHTGLGGGDDNEAAASALVNATSTGDAGSRADHFPGTSLDAAWAAEGTALGAGPTVKHSVVAMLGPSAAPHFRLRPYTPSGAFRVEARLQLKGNGGGGGLMVRDSGTGDASGNGIMIHIGSAGQAQCFTLDTGAYTQRGSDVTAKVLNAWDFFYLAIERNGSNSWTAQLSLDRTYWYTIVTGHSKTFTVAKAGLRLYDVAVMSVDFFDVVS